MQKSAWLLLPLFACPVVRAAPANDHFANAIVLSGSSAEVAVDLNGATREAGEPLLNTWYPPDSPNSVWYRWTAPATGKVFVSVHGEGYSTAISVYIGTAVNALTQTGTAPYDYWYPYNPPSSRNGWLVDAVAGTTYRIAAWQYGYMMADPSAGLSLLQGTFPQSNDNFASATALPANGASTNLAGHTYLATHQGDAGEPDLGWGALRSPAETPTLWYAVTPDFTGFAEFHTGAATCPLEVAVYSGTSLTALTRVTMNGMAGPDGKTVVRWKCTAGTPYRIRVAAGIDEWYFLTRFTASFTRLTPADTVRSYVLEARTMAALQVPGCLQAAGALLEQALSLAPADAEAHFLLAFTRLALLGETPDFKAMVGAVTGDTHATFDPYVKPDRITIAKDVDGDPILPATSNPQELVTWMLSSLLPELAAIRAHLDQVPSSFTTALTAAETGDEMHLEIDHADIKAIAASTHALEMLVDFLTTYNLSVPVRTLVAWDKTGDLTAEQVRATYVDLLKFSSSDRRLQFRQQFTQVRLAGETAIAFARNSRIQPAMHMWDTRDILPADEQDLITVGNDIEASFYGATVDLGGTHVNLSQFLSTTASLRSWLPMTSRGKLVARTLPDPTFDGIFPAFTTADAETLLGNLVQVVNLGTFSTYIGHMLEDSLPQDRLPGADPDRDGRTNAHEYVFGGDPLTAGLERQVAVVVQTAGADVTALRVTFSRRRDVADATYRVAVSDNLQTWDRSHAKVTMIGAPVRNEDGLTETVHYSIQGLPGTKPPQFVRLEATIR